VVIEMLMAIVKNAKSTDRAKTAAARVLGQYKRLNLDAIRTSASVQMGDVMERLEELEERHHAAMESGQ
jgi:hypothetical protein